MKLTQKAVVMFTGLLFPSRDNSKISPSFNPLFHHCQKRPFFRIFSLLSYINYQVSGSRHYCPSDILFFPFFSSKSQSFFM